MELSTKVVGYNASKELRNVSDATGVNPYLAIVLYNATINRTIFDIDDYGRAFQDKDDWNVIR